MRWIQCLNAIKSLESVLAKIQSARTLLLKHNHYATNKSANHSLQCHKRKLTFHYTGTGNLAPKKRIQWNRYHYYIRQSGEVVNTRSLSRIGAHAKGYNRNSIGICYEGGLDKDGKPKDTRTPEQRVVLRQLVDELLARFPNCKVCGHRDLSPDLNRNGRIEPHEWTKQCPCFDVATEL